MSTPPESSKSLRQPGIIVYCCGLGTSLLVLWGVNALNNNGTNIMGLYANGIIPAGALIVGVASGLGYAIGSWLLNVKLSKAFVAGMITTALLDYAAAQWVTWSNILDQHHISAERYSFLQYIRDICENMAFKSSSSKEAGSPLGMFGYFFKLLEMAGYALGAMIPSAVLRGMPYCHGCQYYLKKYQSNSINASSSWAEIKKLPKAQRKEQLIAAINQVCTRAQEVLDSIKTTSLTETAEKLSKLDKTSTKDSPASVVLNLKKCPRCEGHHVAATLINKTVDKKVANKVIAKIDKTEISALPAAPAPAG